MMSASYEIRGPGYMWRVLENNIPDVKEEIEQMKMCSDRKVLESYLGPWQNLAYPVLLVLVKILVHFHHMHELTLILTQGVHFAGDN